MLHRPTLALLLCLGAPALLDGCRLTTPGQANHLQFSFEDTGDFLDQSAIAEPLERGDTVSLVAFHEDASDALDPVPLVEVTSTSPNVVAVGGESALKATLEAKSPGTTTLKVTGATGFGGDTIEVSVAEVDRVELQLASFLGRAGANEPVVLLEGGTFLLHAQRFDAAGRPLVGFGLHPIAVRPPGAADLGPGGASQPVTLHALGDLTLLPQHGIAVALPPVVPPAAVTRLALGGFGSAAGSLAIGKTRSFFLVAHTADALAAGTTDLATFENQTPAVCSIAMADLLASPGADALYEVTGLAAGRCAATFRLGHASTALALDVAP